MKNFIKMIPETIKFLDTLDLTPFFPKDRCMDPDEIIDKIEQYYNEDHPELLPTKFEGRIFNYLTNYEIVEYLAKRYNCRIQEVTKYYLIK